MSDEYDRLAKITKDEANQRIHKLNECHKNVMGSIRALAYSHVAIQMNATNFKEFSKVNEAVSMSRQSNIQLQNDIQKYLTELSKYGEVIAAHVMELQMYKAREETNESHTPHTIW